MQRPVLSFAVAAFCLVASAPGFSQTATSSRTRTHVQTLASDKFEGRLTGSPGEKLAADYLFSELKSMGAKPLPGMTDFRMPFTLTAGSKVRGSSVTTVTARPHTRAPSFSHSATVDGAWGYAG